MSFSKEKLLIAAETSFDYNSYTVKPAYLKSTLPIPTALVWPLFRSIQYHILLAALIKIEFLVKTMIDS